MEVKRAAVLVEHEYEDQELWYPYLRLTEEGYDVAVVGPDANREYASKHGYKIKSCTSMVEALRQDWDAVVIPGGWAPDRLRIYPEMVDLVRKVNEADGVVAAICHGPSLLVSADAVKGKNVTSYVAIKDDLRHAGGSWVDAEVVIDGNLITSRTPKDLIPFTKAILEALKK
ncbi:MAG: type 1 glutamine amidotransferase [Firmicutes bacterium]|nr:type 1 glutamine amidotransferase [Bacillota bacterium]